MSYFVIKNKTGDYYTGSRYMGTQYEACQYQSREDAESSLSDAQAKCKNNIGLRVVRVHKKGVDFVYLVKSDDGMYLAKSGIDYDYTYDQSEAMRIDSHRVAKGQITYSGGTIVKLRRKTNKVSNSFLVVFNDESSMVVEAAHAFAAIEDTMSFIDSGKFAEREEWISSVDKVIRQ